MLTTLEPQFRVSPATGKRGDSQKKRVSIECTAPDGLRASPLRWTRNGVPNVTGAAPSCQVPASSSSSPRPFALWHPDKQFILVHVSNCKSWAAPMLDRCLDAVFVEMPTKLLNLGVLEPNKHTAVAWPVFRLCLSLFQDQLETVESPGTPQQQVCPRRLTQFFPQGLPHRCVGRDHARNLPRGRNRRGVWCGGRWRPFLTSSAEDAHSMSVAVADERPGFPCSLF